MICINGSCNNVALLPNIWNVISGQVLTLHKDFKFWIIPRLRRNMSAILLCKGFQIRFIHTCHVYMYVYVR